jgi:shikimate kinase
LKTVAIVESEKTAIIASLCLPQFIWLATGSKQWLKADRLRRLENRQVILYPDADGFDQWQSIASDASKQGLIVKTSALIELRATAEQKRNQYDLADYLIEQQREINQFNQMIDQYNAKLETVLNDKSLFCEFETILDEQIAVMIVNCKLPEQEAGRICAQAENLRSIVMNL